MTNEDKALALASDRRALRKRLNDARSCLTDHFRKPFGRGRLDFNRKRLIGDNGLALQWNTRPLPEMVETYHNQQTSRGTVTLVRNI